MKKLNYVLAAAMVVVLATTSCQKEEFTSSLTSSDSWKENVEQYVLHTGHQNPKGVTVQDKKSAAIVGADMVGGWDGATSGAVFGPWGVAIGGVFAGAGASIGAWAIFPRMANPDADTVPTTNPYWYIGKLHNEICLAAVNDPSVISDGKLNDLYTELANSRIEKTVTLQGGEMINFNFSDYSENINKIDDAVSNGEIYIPENRDPNVTFLMEKCITGINRCNTSQETLDFIRGYEDIVNKAPISDKDKEMLMIGLSIGSYSTKLWYQ